MRPFLMRLYRLLFFLVFVTCRFFWLFRSLLRYQHQFSISFVRFCLEWLEEVLAKGGLVYLVGDGKLYFSTA
jgi:hypothetical protein